jgi:SpoU rRNA methylase family enzyme
MQLATVLVPLAFAVVGAFVYALASKDKVVEMGRIAFAVGLLWLVYVLAHVTLSVHA